jgi:hypothetical protein
MNVKGQKFRISTKLNSTRENKSFRFSNLDVEP